MSELSEHLVKALSIMTEKNKKLEGAISFERSAAASLKSIIANGTADNDRLIDMLDKERHAVNKKDEEIRSLQLAALGKDEEIETFYGVIGVIDEHCDRADIDPDMSPDQRVEKLINKYEKEREEYLERQKGCDKCNTDMRAKFSKINAEKLEFMNQVKHYIGDTLSYRRIIKQYKENMAVFKKKKTVK